jgi:hypothetical protein
LHDAFALCGELLDTIADHLCSHLRARKEGREEFPDRGFSEDKSDRDQDPDPRCKRANAGKQARSAPASDASDAASVAWKDDLNERKQADKGKERQDDTQRDP